MVGQRPGGQYVFGAVMGEGDDHAVSGQLTAGGVNDKAAGAGAALGAGQGRSHRP